MRRQGGVRSPGQVQELPRRAAALESAAGARAPRASLAGQPVINDNRPKAIFVSAWSVTCVLYFDTRSHSYSFQYGEVRSVPRAARHPLARARSPTARQERARRERAHAAALPRGRARASGGPRGPRNAQAGGREGSRVVPPETAVEISYCTTRVLKLNTVHEQLIWTRDDQWIQYPKMGLSGLAMTYGLVTPVLPPSVAPARPGPWSFAGTN